MPFEYEIVINQFNNVSVFRRYANGHLRFWAYATPPCTGRAVRLSESRLGTNLPRQCVERAIDLAVANYTDAPITISSTR
jgi:hypothetical protein